MHSTKMSEVTIREPISALRIDSQRPDPNAISGSSFVNTCACNCPSTLESKHKTFHVSVVGIPPVRSIQLTPSVPVPNDGRHGQRVKQNRKPELHVELWEETEIA
jgi:hypothetical protein